MAVGIWMGVVVSVAESAKFHLIPPSAVANVIEPPVPILARTVAAPILSILSYYTNKSVPLSRSMATLLIDERYTALWVDKPEDNLAGSTPAPVEVHF